MLNNKDSLQNDKNSIREMESQVLVANKTGAQLKKKQGLIEKN